MDLDRYNKLKEIYQQFDQEHNPSEFAWSVGIGIDSDLVLAGKTSEMGFVLYFRSKKNLEDFSASFEADFYEGVPIFKKVVGKVVGKAAT